MDYPIEYFKIKGLHGYKDVEIRFAGKTTVIVAENGTGKTTVLNALNAFLTRRFHRLSAITFDSIECGLRGSLFPISLAKSQIGTRSNDSDVLTELVRSASIAESDLVDFVRNVYIPGEVDRFSNHVVVRQIYLNTPHDMGSVGSLLDELHSHLDNALTEAAKAASAQVASSMEGLEIVFLPTYRRIERPLVRQQRHRVSHRRTASEKAEHDDMAFGLADVQDRLAQLSEDIERRSNFQYRTLTARMLEDMLKGPGERKTVEQHELPDIDSLVRFLSRVGQRDNILSGENFDRIRSLYESGEIYRNTSHWFLQYFLSQLALVINRTRETELVIEQFVSICNSYLTLSSDEKSLTFDPGTLSVVVRNSWREDPISLDDLSSGEKQIVSLMSRLYLNSRPKVVLIDEPELSLSIDWQRKVLVDISNSPSVAQLLAITHSPFVFENELDEFARPLNVTRSEAANVEPSR